MRWAFFGSGGGYIVGWVQWSCVDRKGRLFGVVVSEFGGRNLPLSRNRSQAPDHAGRDSSHRRIETMRIRRESCAH
jgi:hypothetical protein